MLPTADRNERLLTPAFLLCFSGSFVQCLAFNLYLHLPGFLKDLGADEVLIGLIAGLTAVAAIASRPTVGRSMDVSGRRPVILLGGALNVVVLCLYLTVTSIGPWIVVVRILHGLAESMLFSGYFTYAADIIPASRRTEGIALFGISGMLPISLGGVLGDAILARGDFSDLFLASIGLALLSFLISLLLRERRPAFQSETAPRGFAATAVQRNLLPLWFIGTVFATAITGVFIFLKTWVMETGIGSVGLFFTAYSVSAVLLRLVFGWVPDRFGSKRVLFPSLGLVAIGLALLPRSVDSAGLALAGALCGLGHGFTFPILIGIVVTRARDSERGAAMAVFTALFDAGVLLGGPVLGAVIRVFGYTAMFSTAGAALVLGTLIFAFWDRHEAVR